MLKFGSSNLFPMNNREMVIIIAHTPSTVKNMYYTYFSSYCILLANFRYYIWIVIKLCHQLDHLTWTIWPGHVQLNIIGQVLRATQGVRPPSEGATRQQKGRVLLTAIFRPKSTLYTDC